MACSAGGARKTRHTLRRKKSEDPPQKQFTAEEIAKLEQAYMTQLPIVAALLSGMEEETIDPRLLAVSAIEIMNALLDELEEQ